jgi:glycosyltransferase involved in cell wall biosynthesis
MPHRLYVVMVNAYGTGGIARTVVNLANALVERHQVEIITVYRRRTDPAYPIDPRVTVSQLVDARKGVRTEGDPEHDRLARLPSRLTTALDQNMTALTDELIVERLRELEPGILITTRPALHALAAEFAPGHVITVAQDHLNVVTRMAQPELAALMHRSLAAVDGLAVLTEADALDYTRMLAGSGTVVTAIPNALPWRAGAASPLTSKTIVSAGRLVEQKGFDRLIEAFAPVASSHPDWQLHIYGTGEQGQELRRLVRRLRLGEQVRFMGYSDSMQDVLRQAAVYALGSRFEGFGMVLIEAMSVGLPLVSFDCPRGPGEIIDDGVTGTLVPDGDVPRFSAALRELVASDPLRRRMGANAREQARAYEMPAVIDRWESLFAALFQRHGSRASRSTATGHG